MVGALVLLWSRVLTPREAYASIDWQVLLMLYGLLGLGMAHADHRHRRVAGRALVAIAGRLSRRNTMPMVVLWLIFLLTLALTEVLSNNATAVMMIPIVVTLARALW